MPLHLNRSPEYNPDLPIPELAVSYLANYIAGAQPEAEHFPRAVYSPVDPDNSAPDLFPRTFRELAVNGVPITPAVFVRLCRMAVDETRAILDLTTDHRPKAPAQFAVLKDTVWLEIADLFDSPTKPN